MNNVKISTEKLKEYFYNRFKTNNYNEILMKLYDVNEREKIINELAENQEEAYFYNNIYEKTLDNIKKIFEHNQKSKNMVLTQQLKQELQQNNLLEIAKNAGYKTNKIYNETEIKELNENIQILIQQTKDKQEKQKEQQKINLYKKLITIFFIFVNPITIIIYFLIWGYFKFAIPILS